MTAGLRDRLASVGGVTDSSTVFVGRATTVSAVSIRLMPPFAADDAILGGGGGTCRARVRGEAKGREVREREEGGRRGGRAGV